MSALYFERQASGYKVRRALKKDGKTVLEMVGTIVKENDYSREYKPNVDIDGNVSGWYGSFHDKSNFLRYLDKAIHEVKQPYMFVYSKNFNEMLQYVVFLYTLFYFYLIINSSCSGSGFQPGGSFFRG